MSERERLDRRKRVWLAAIASATLASVVCVAVVALRSHSVPTTAIPSTDPSAFPLRQTIKLSDGSVIAIDPAESEVRVIEDLPFRIRVEAVRGSGRYWVTPNSNRTFEVRSGPVTVTVVGTEFVVDRRAESTRVEVARGKVGVSCCDEQVLLTDGESRIFPREPSTSSRDAPAERFQEIDVPTALAQRETQRYRSRVARHDYRGAYAVLSRNPTVVGETADELLVAADVARFSGHPSRAAGYLQNILREYPRDERAPMAAFTLGRTLSGLGRTQEAMNTFGRVRSDWPKSRLGEDALVRQAEAASQLGDLGTARRLAKEYDRAYPNGRLRSEVRRHAQLE